MGLFKNDAPAPPNYEPLAQASKASAELSYKLGQDQLAWAKEQYAKDSAVTDEVVQQFLSTQKVNAENAAKDRARYETTFQPLEDDLARDARDYSSAGRRDLEMGRAQAGVAQQFDTARTAAQRELESYGVNPGATRFAALDIGMRTQQAAAEAAAGTQAGLAVDATGRALRSEAINVGRGYPAQIAGQYGTAQGAGAGAVNSELSTTASGANTMGTAPQWQSLGNSAIGTWGNILNTQYNNQLSQYNANNSGWGTALGLLGGFAAKKFGFFAGGGAVDDATTGGPVPTGASPTQGQAIDDVPAQLTAGEFVIPRDVVGWVGEKGMHQMIVKARQDMDKAKQQSQAIPTTGPAPNTPPTFVSGQQALPVG